VPYAFTSLGQNYTQFQHTTTNYAGNTEIFQVSNMNHPRRSPRTMDTPLHGLYIDRVNSISPSYENLLPTDVHENDDFAVLSVDHLECLKIFAKFGMFTSSMGGECHH